MNIKHKMISQWNGFHIVQSIVTDFMDFTTYKVIESIEKYLNPHRKSSEADIKLLSIKKKQKQQIILYSRIFNIHNGQNTLGSLLDHK